MKPAGGIRTTKDAIKYLVLVNETAGDDWLTPTGSASAPPRLLNDLLMQRQKLTHRPLLRPRLRHGGLIAMASHSSTHPRPSPAPIVDIAPSYGLFIDGEFADGRRQGLQDRQPRHRGGARRGRRGRRRRRRPRGEGRPQGLRAVWSAHAGRRARQVPVPDRADHPGARAASSPCWSRSTTASRSGSPATSTSRWSPRTSSTTRAGPTSSSYAGYGRPAAARRRRPGHPVELPAADAGVEDRPGARLPATRSCSSPPRPPR